MSVPSNLVACPTCASQPGEFCRDDSGKPLSYVHAARVEAAFFISNVDSGADNGNKESSEEGNGSIF